MEKKRAIQTTREDFFFVSKKDNFNNKVQFICKMCELRKLRVTKYHNGASFFIIINIIFIIIVFQQGNCLLFTSICILSVLVQCIHEFHQFFSPQESYQGAWKLHFCTFPCGNGCDNCTRKSTALTTHFDLALSTLIHKTIPETRKGNGRSKKSINNNKQR